MLKTVRFWLFVLVFLLCLEWCEAMAPTPFEKAVHSVVKQIPKGKVASYKAVSEVAGGSARSIGGAMKRNPYAPIVPCHRVVASDRSLGGFRGQTGGAELDRKRKMLEDEGVRFDGNKVHPDDFLAEMPAKKPRDELREATLEIVEAREKTV